ncbi:hypothetical protein EGJ82_17265 [Klebsiella pneumoniae]|nr:hypothetical protein EGJ99_19020 [Klebsiella pneumoniae]RRY67193.1 hypothetical protein EGJ88_18910 [Klebsiella pneumoniae]RRY72884.1 hypothetical protein EGJ82_17265 [Klebsiella pneumoniae]RRZ05286.1 hypothetical protein EGK03_22090 [Klebsiella pneumoniae]RRZ21122.1 hypothetical protein EGK12_21850 [Klebsiella pneumoniae]
MHQPHHTRLKTPTSYRQATETPTSYRQATETPTDFPTATSCRNRTLGRLTPTAIIKQTRKQVV